MLVRVSELMCDVSRWATPWDWTRFSLLVRRRGTGDLWSPCMAMLSAPVIVLFHFVDLLAHQFWNLAGKSMLSTCPITEVILKVALWPCHRPEYSCTSW